jgi:hypothetical protein
MPEVVKVKVLNACPSDRYFNELPGIWCSQFAKQSVSLHRPDSRIVMRIIVDVIDKLALAFIVRQEVKQSLIHWQYPCDFTPRILSPYSNFPPGKVYISPFQLQEF